MRLPKGGNCKNFLAWRRISGKKNFKKFFFHRARAKIVNFLKNQGGPLIFLPSSLPYILVTARPCWQLPLNKNIVAKFVDFFLYILGQKYA